MADNFNTHDDGVQHGIDNNPSGDPGKGALLGGVGGAVVGALAGGPIGAVVGAVAGAAASGVAIGAVDHVDNDNTVSGVGSGVTPELGTHVDNQENTYANTGTGHTTDNYDNLESAHTTGAYGTYEGRDISRTDYDALSEPERLKVQLLSEKLHVDKETRQAGEVEITKRVVSEQVEVPVTLEREEVVIHRRNLDSTASGNAVIGDETIVVPISEQVAQVSKTTHVTGEVEVEKRVVSENKTITDTVRHEEADIKSPDNSRIRVEDDTRGTI